MIKTFRSSRVPHSFWGRSAPCLQEIEFSGIPLLVVGKLLLSISHWHLINLHLTDIPCFDYVSPHALVTGLSVLIRLRSLVLEFRSFIYGEGLLQVLLPPTRPILTARTKFRFKGNSGYLEDIVSRIDAPLLLSFTIAFSEPVAFDTPHLH